jgi:RNA polymerase sigma-70 factor, ECF subfamily
LSDVDIFANLPRTDPAEDAADRARRFAQLLNDHHRDLFGFIFSLVQHHADAEDVYQQTALVLWSKFDDFAPGTNFGAWSTRVAHLTSRDFLRSRRRRSQCFSDEMLELIASAYRPQGADHSARRSEALAECLAKLSRRDRRLVDRCYSRERDFAAIAHAENRSVAAIYQAMCRIRKGLHRCVQRTLTMEGR